MQSTSSKDTSSKKQPQQKQQDQEEQENRESQSAPSSPTDNAIANPMDNIQNRSPSPVVAGRPRSMMVGADQIKYSIVSFQDGSRSSAPHPAARRNINVTYSNICHLPITTYENLNEKEEETDKGQIDDGCLPPSYVGVGVCQSHGSAQNTQAENSNYDVPPPPVPIRFESQDASNSVGAGGGETDLFSSAKNHFVDDPFGAGVVGNAWGESDPSAVYDTPNSAITDTQQQQPPQQKPNEDQENMYQDIAEVTTGTTSSSTAADLTVDSTADCTGDSTYEDTRVFLEDIRSRYKNNHPDEVLALAGGRGTLEANQGEECVYDVPPVEEVVDGVSGGKNLLGSREEEERQGSSYDFPFELNRYPFKEAGEEEWEAPKEESSLHAMHYPPQAGQEQPPHRHSTNRSHSMGQSDAAGIHPRQNVPLPLTPDEETVEGLVVEGAPPLPARPVGPVTSATSSGHGGKAPLSKDGSVPPHGQSTERPRLPPFNHPWGNKPTGIPAPPTPTSTSSSASHSDFPPLPPRKKNLNGQSSVGSESGVVPPSPAQLSPQESFDDLLSRGYNKADIERAMRIAMNDYEMAKNILQEFGAKN